MSDVTGEPFAVSRVVDPGGLSPQLKSAEFRAAFVAAQPFPLDRFQVEALDLIDADESVLVAAPTGSGKTLVAEYAIARARALGTRAFYTTPLKALSNQKYHDFCRLYGADEVGLLTGDISLRSEAPIVVMTTEVLRNMIYSKRSSLEQLSYVILDEVHYLADRYRGSVWEEIILSAPEHVVLVSLSATVSNADELARWMGLVRGATGAVIEVARPIRLEQLYVVGDRHGGGVRVLPTFVDGKPNPEASAFDPIVTRSPSRHPKRRDHQQRSGTRPRGASRPRRVDVLERFARDDLLPAIYFVFSRAGCDSAVRQCLDDQVRLTTREERAVIREVADRHVDRLSDADLRALSYGRFLHGLECGIAPHHAGMVPVFREAVEELFSAALVKVVFSTETLALGVNMPARSVIIESLSKFGGSGHKDLTAGEYTQLTGRAGRRGIDELGYAVVLWSPLHHFEQVATLASARTSALHSSFRPNYNMAVNLVRRYDRRAAFRLVESSFAQFVSDVALSSQLDAVLALLSERGYLAGWHVTAAGERLAGLYHECDLLIAEAIGAGLFDGLDLASLAALASCVTYEARRADASRDYPSSRLARRFDELDEIARGLRTAERAAGLARTRRPDPGFMRTTYEWARGAEFASLVGVDTHRAERGRPQPSMSGGDFVRNMKQLVDLLRQIAATEGTTRLAIVAARASEELVRGVVAASSGLGPIGEEQAADDPR